MQIFYIHKYREDDISSYPKNSFYLSTDSWDDFGFVTKFHMYYIDSDNLANWIGEIKIGYIGQPDRESDKSGFKYYATKNYLPNSFKELDEEFFSLGQSPGFYANLFNIFNDNAISILERLNDLSMSLFRIDLLKDENVFNTSLLRSVSKWQIKNQFFQIAHGRKIVDDYKFVFKYKDKNLVFNVDALSSPPTNIHAIIGKNGVGKTTILNSMFEDLVKENENGNFLDSDLLERYNFDIPLNSDYFSKIIYISYSIFGNYIPTIRRNEKFLYMGLKDLENENLIIKNLDTLYNEFVGEISNINSSSTLKTLLEKILPYFSASYDANLIELLDNLSALEDSQKDFYSLSSGHSIVLMIIVNLIANVNEKTLVLFDEPETHLHPPLLSALIRAINDIVVEKNGVCIFATHSPVVIQEIPQSCVQIIRRFGNALEVTRPRVECFGENVSTLTHEVFSLEVSATGFYNLIKSLVEQGLSTDQITEKFNNQLGSEAASLLYLLEYDKEDKQWLN